MNNTGSSEMSRDLMDDDGENRAVRTFLQMYGGMNSCTTKQMRDHLEMSGFGGCWPDWTEQDAHLSKGGAQAWLRYLFALERADASAHLTTANTLGGFRGGFIGTNRRAPTDQEIWNAAVRSGMRRAVACATPEGRAIDDMTDAELKLFFHARGLFPENVGYRNQSEFYGAIRSLCQQPDGLRARVSELESAIESALSWIESGYRPPVPEESPCGTMVCIRLHALADLHKALYGEYAKDRDPEEISLEVDRIKKALGMEGG